MKRNLLTIASVLILFAACKHGDKIPNADWPKYGGNDFGNRYSTLTQINKENVKDLKVAWIYETGDNKDTTKRGIGMQCQPIVIKGIMYGVSPKLKAFAIDAKTGKELWRFDPFAHLEPMYHPSRGVTYWESGNDKRIIYAAGSFIYELNAANGQLVDGFGDHGKVDLYTGLQEGLDHDVHQQYVTQTTPGIVYKNTYVMGTMSTESGDAAPGPVRAFDVLTGKLKWIFHTIPFPGEEGYNTWSPDSYKYNGAANNWSGLTLDEKRGTVYTGTGSGSVDYYGAERKGTNFYADCILALDAETGKLKWHFQFIHHDLWDRDLPAPPNLFTLKKDGKMIDVLATAGKDGVVYVLDRDSGKPIFPVVERPVPTANPLKGDEPWPTQPYPVKPAPFSVQYLTEDLLTDLTPEDHAFALKRFLTTRRGNKFEPPSREGTIVFGIGGGAEWGGTSVDPDGVMYVNANNMPWDLRMLPADSLNKAMASSGKRAFMTNCSGCHGADRKGGGEFPSLVDIDKKLDVAKVYSILQSGSGRMPSFKRLQPQEKYSIVKYLFGDKMPADLGARSPHNSGVTKNQTPPPAKPGEKSKYPYSPPFVSNGFVQFRGPDGYPAIKPPWGTLNAIDLKTGDYKWKVPLGEYEELTKKGIKPTGTENHGGMVVTAGGLLFIAATEDNYLRAFDKDSGEVLWKYKLPAGGIATPITYAIDGKQYVVIAAGGAKYGKKAGGSFLAFAIAGKK